MTKLNKQLAVFVLIFLACFSVLYLLVSNSNSIENGMAKTNSVVGETIFNVLNPELYCDYVVGAPDNPRGFDFTFNVYDNRNVKRKVNKKSAKRSQIDRIILQDHFILFIVPFIFLTALFVASPVSWKTKALRYPIGLLLLYILIAFHLSYRFELVFTNNNFEINSIWLFFTWLFGLGGTYDNIFIIAAVFWIALLGWPIYKRFSASSFA